MLYEIQMSDGNIAEADSLPGALTAALTMHSDSERSSFVAAVLRNGTHCQWATAACRVHVDEQTGGVLTGLSGESRS